MNNFDNLTPNEVETKFNKFLEDNNCKTEFYEAFNSDVGGCRKLKFSDPLGIIDDALIWYKTSQGNAFWSNIDIKWEIIL